MSNTNTLITTIACTLVLLSACSTPQKRQVYSAPDNVGTINTAIFPGEWQQTMLNPLEGEETADVKMSFSADGTMKIVSQSKTMPETGVFEATGVWEVSGDRFRMDMTDMKEVSGNKLAAMALTFVRNMTKKTTGTANPYEISQNRIVWLIEDSGQAVQLDRIN